MSETVEDQAAHEAITPHSDLLARSNLTSRQFQIWLSQTLTPESRALYVVLSFEVDAELDSVRFEQAVRNVYREHEATRMVVEERDGIPQLRIVEDVPSPYCFVDWQTEGDSASFDEWLRHHMYARLKLDTQLAAVTLVKMDTAKCRVCIATHHLISDQWSTSLIFTKINEEYERRTTPAPPMSFRAYAERERRTVFSKAHRESVGFWERKLAKALPPLEYYGFRERQGIMRSTQHVLPLGEGRSKRMDALARTLKGPSHQFRLLTVFLGMFGTYLFRITGGENIRIALPIHGRITKEFKNTIGLMMDILIAELALRPEMSFHDVISHSSRELVEMFRRPIHGLGNRIHPPTYHFSMNFTPFSFGTFLGSVPRVRLHHSGHGDGREVLGVLVHDYEQKGAYELVLDFRADISNAQASRAMTHLLAAIDFVTSAPGAPIGDAHLLDSEELSVLVDCFAWGPKLESHRNG